MEPREDSSPAPRRESSSPRFTLRAPPFLGKKVPFPPRGPALQEVPESIANLRRDLEQGEDDISEDVKKSSTYMYVWPGVRRKVAPCFL